MFSYYLFFIIISKTLCIQTNWFRSASTSNEVNSQNDFRHRYPNNISRNNNHRILTAGGWRPKASDHHLPVVALLENPDTKFDPTNSDLDETNLRLLLNDAVAGVDPTYSSVKKPIVYNGTIEFPFDSTKRSKIVVNSKIPRQFRNLFKYNELPNGAPAKLHLKSQFKKRVYDYLWAYTYCPVIYSWKDLGLRFWPRWIKDGRCFNKRSCSIPPGMSCKPAASKQIVLLRWHCRNWQTAYYCSWIKIHYPILTGCSCSCWHRTNFSNEHEFVFVLNSHFLLF